MMSADLEASVPRMNCANQTMNVVGSGKLPKMTYVGVYGRWRSPVEGHVESHVDRTGSSDKLCILYLIV